jgi:hypothetical protein
MADLEQVVYASRATFPSGEAYGGIEPQVARILVQSRLNNPKRGLVGALYFGDGHFFQVLEGIGAELDALLAKILRDSRHERFEILIRRRVPDRGFHQWSMKYVALESDIQALLRRHGLSRFDPARFPPALVEELVTLLQQGKAAPEAAALDPAGTVERPSGVDRRSALIGAAAGLALGVLATVLAFSLAG